MSKFYALLALVLLTALGKAKAQAYEVQLDEAPYESLSTPTKLNSSPWPQWHRYPNLPLGFEFRFFDQVFERVHLEVSSRLVFDEGHFYFFDPLAMVHLKDVGTGAIAYQTEGNAGDRVFSIEYRDVRLARDTSKYVNFQVRLYEKDYALELHMGPHSKVDASADLQLGPYCGVHQLNSVSPIDFKDALNLVGDPADPEQHYFSGRDASYLNYRLEALPTEGQVIRFSPSQAQSVPPKRLAPKLHWNAQQARVKNMGQQDCTVKVYNLLGQCCLEQRLLPGAGLSIAQLPKGSYLLVSENQSLKILL